MTSDWFLLSQCSGGLDALGEIWGAWKGRKWWVERRAVVWEWDCGSSVRQRRCPIRLPVPLMPGSDTGVKALQSATSVKTTAFLYIGNISKKLSGVCVSYTLLCVENIHENKHILQAAAEQNGSSWWVVSQLSMYSGILLSWAKYWRIQVYYKDKTNIYSNSASGISYSFAVMWYYIMLQCEHNITAFKLTAKWMLFVSLKKKKTYLYCVDYMPFVQINFL